MPTGGAPVVVSGTTSLSVVQSRSCNNTDNSSRSTHERSTCGVQLMPAAIVDGCQLLSNASTDEFEGVLDDKHAASCWRNLLPLALWTPCLRLWLMNRGLVDHPPILIDYKMLRFSFQDGIHILNIGKTWEKLVLAARIIVAIENPQVRMVALLDALVIVSVLMLKLLPLWRATLSLP